MSESDHAFERLRHANPFPVVEIDRPTGEQFLEAIHLPIPEPISAQRRRPVFALAAAAAVLLVAFQFVRLLSDSESPTATQTPIELTPDIAALVDGDHLDGAYRASQLGTPFTFSIDHPGWGHTVARDGYVEVQDPDHTGDLRFVRATELSNPVEPFTSFVTDPWPINDIDGWLDRLDRRIEVTNLTTANLKGSDVIRFDLAVAAGAPCASGSACAAFVTNHGIDGATIESGETQRVWWVDQGGFEPIVIVASGPAEVIDAATSIVETVEFGPVQPHPIADGDVWERGMSADVTAGTVRLPALGGVQFDLAQPQRVEQGADYVEFGATTFARVDIAYVVLGPDRDPIGTIADVESQLRSKGVTVTPAGNAAAALGGGQVFDLLRGPEVDAGVSLANNEEGRNWRVPATARLWLFETERGVLMVGAGTNEGTFGLDEAVDLAESVVSSLTLIDPTELPG